MLEVSTEKPKCVRISITVAGGDPEKTVTAERYSSDGQEAGEILKDVLASSFGEKADRKPRAKRRSRSEMESIRKQKAPLEVPAPEVPIADGSVVVEEKPKGKKKAVWA